METSLLYKFYIFHFSILLKKKKKAHAAWRRLLPSETPGSEESLPPLSPCGLRRSLQEPRSRKQQVKAGASAPGRPLRVP